MLQRFRSTSTKFSAVISFNHSLFSTLVIYTTVISK